MYKMSEYDKAHIGDILLKGNWFTADLLRLISKADLENKERLRIAYPEVVAAYEQWYTTKEKENETRSRTQRDL